jgi:hypothetical protein
MHNCFECDPQGYIASRLRIRIRGALTRQSATKEVDTFELIGCSIEEFRVYFEAMFSDGMDWDNISEWHIDHRRPCASFDLTNEEEQRICFHYTNLQPLWAEENLSKHDDYDPEAFEWEWTGDKWEPIERPLTRP